jgi:Ubiquitin carboxyl-terminal hydrolase
MHDAFDFLLDVLVDHMHRDIVELDLIPAFEQLQPDAVDTSASTLVVGQAKSAAPDIAPEELEQDANESTEEAWVASLEQDEDQSFRSDVHNPMEARHPDPLHSTHRQIDRKHSHEPPTDGPQQPDGADNVSPSFCLEHNHSGSATAGEPTQRKPVRLVVDEKHFLSHKKKYMDSFDRLARNAWERRQESLGHSVYTSHMYGQYVKIVRCLRCKKLSITFPLFLFMDIDLSAEDFAQDEELSLLDMIDRLRRSRALKTYRCISCFRATAAPTEATVSLNIWKLPDVLMIRLARVKNKVKQCHSVRFPVSTVAMRGFLSSKAPLPSQQEKYAHFLHPTLRTRWASYSNTSVFNSDGSDDSDNGDCSTVEEAKMMDEFPFANDEEMLSYHLSAVLNHEGKSSSEGHYVAHIRHLLDDQFYMFDDHIVKPLDDDKFSTFRKQKGIGDIEASGWYRSTPDVYVLFYYNSAVRRFVGLPHSDRLTEPSTPNPTIEERTNRALSCLENLQAPLVNLIPQPTAPAPVRGCRGCLA